MSWFHFKDIIIKKITTLLLKKPNWRTLLGVRSQAKYFTRKFKQERSQAQLVSILKSQWMILTLKNNYWTVFIDGFFRGDGITYKPQLSLLRHASADRILPDKTSWQSMGTNKIVPARMAARVTNDGKTNGR